MKRSVGMEVSTLGPAPSSTELELIDAIHHDLVTCAQAAVDDDPGAVVGAKVGLDADHLIGVLRIAAEQNGGEAVLDDG